MKLCILFFLPLASAFNRGGTTTDYDAAAFRDLISRRLMGQKLVIPVPGGKVKGAPTGMKAPIVVIPPVPVAPVPVAPASPPVIKTTKPIQPVSKKTGTGAPVAPVTPTVKPTVKPVTPTVKPVAPTAAPVTPTVKPVTPTVAPVAPTVVPVAPTAPVKVPAPVSSGPPPVTPTATPVAPTAAPVAPTLAPVAPTAPPTSAPTPTPFSPTALQIAKYAPGGLPAFVAGSYQLKALKYVESRVDVASLSDAKAVQYYALACLYYATFGVSNVITDNLAPGKPVKGWSNSTNWLSKTLDPCASALLWTGVTCDSNKKVFFLQLASNLLTGSIPNEISLLSSDNPSKAGNFNYFDLFGNNLLFNDGDSGGLDWIGDLGSNMQYLYFSETGIRSTKGVPAVLNKLTNLVEFTCARTLITGKLVDAPFLNLKKLEYIELFDLGFNSTIPTVFGSLPALYKFYAYDSFLSGTLDFMKGMQSIFELWVDTNSISGRLPTFLGTLSTLQSFSVTENQLTGTFPTELALLTQMSQMFFYTNKLSGPFPNFLTTLTIMKLFKVEENLLTGTAQPLCDDLGPPFGKLLSLGVDCTGSPGPGKVTLNLGSCSIGCCTKASCGDA